MRTIIYSHLKLTFSSLCCLFTLSYNLNSASDVEFLGVAQLGDTHKFSLHCNKTEQAAWLGLGRVFAGYKLVNYDRNTKRLEVFSASGGVKYLQLGSNGSDDGNNGSSGATTGALDKSIASPVTTSSGLLRRFSDLSPKQQKEFRDPRYVPFLRSSNIEVPPDLKESYEKKILNKSNDYVSKPAKRKGPGLPLVTTADTAEEKKQRLLNIKQQ